MVVFRICIFIHTSLPKAAVGDIFVTTIVSVET